ncbi:MAG: TolC family protein [Gelidibacter sp.]
MKPSIPILTLTFMTLTAIIGYAQESPMSLKECINYTLNNNPSSTIYRNSVEIAKEKVTENKSAFLPSIAASAGMDYNAKLQTSVIPAGSLSDEETTLQMGNKYSNSASVQLDQNIYDRSSAMDIKSAKVDEEIANLEALKENEDLIYNTALAYYEVLTYNEKQKLLEDSKTQYETLVGILKLRYEQGVAKKSEYDRARVNYNNVLSEIEENTSNYQLSLNKLKNAMGASLESDITIEKDSKLEDVSDFSLVEGIAENVENTLDYQIDQKNLELKELEISKNKAAYLPTLSAYANYGASSFGNDFSTAMSTWYDYSTVGLKLNVPIFSGFKNSSKVKQSKLEYDNQILTNKLNVENYKLDIENAKTQLVSSYANLKKNKENLDLAKDVLDASTLEYREGTTDLSDLLDVDFSFKESRTNFITSLFDYLNAQIGYQKSKGSITDYVNNLK